MEENRRAWLYKKSGPVRYFCCSGVNVPPENVGFCVNVTRSGPCTAVYACVYIYTRDEYLYEDG